MMLSIIYVVNIIQRLLKPALWQYTAGALCQAHLVPGWDAVLGAVNYLSAEPAINCKHKHRL